MQFARSQPQLARGGLRRGAGASLLDTSNCDCEATRFGRRHQERGRHPFHSHVRHADGGEDEVPAADQNAAQVDRSQVQEPFRVERFYPRVDACLMQRRPREQHRSREPRALRRRGGGGQRCATRALLTFRNEVAAARPILPLLRAVVNVDANVDQFWSHDALARWFGAGSYRRGQPAPVCRHARAWPSSFGLGGSYDARRSRAVWWEQPQARGDECARA
mmetsp:Transcript_70985/g.188881  ORF Transcript_70985/g.188881 Transcript_70985/m.188881 type:complete len:220 (+) Transcript_70985:298-957(+)